MARLDEGHGLYVAERRQEHIGDPESGGMQKIHDIHGLVEADGLLNSVALRHVRRQIRESFGGRTVPVGISAPEFRVKPRGGQKDPAARL